VVEHLIRKIQSLEERDREFLTRASILGDRFTPDAFARFFGESHGECGDAIQALTAAHLLVKSGGSMMFAHDQVRQAARAMLDDETASALHLHVGRRIQADLAARGSADERIEEYIHHFNAAEDLITDATQRLEMAKLNTALGKRLKSNAAYQAAEKSFAKAIAFLPEKPFESDYDLAMDLFTEYGEVLYLNLKYEEGEKRFDAVLAHSKSPLDSARVYVKQIVHYTYQDNPKKAMNIALRALEKLGVKLPEKRLKIAAFVELLNIKLLLRNKKPEDVLDGPVTEDPMAIAQTDVLSAARTTAYQAWPDYLPLIVFRMMRIFLAGGVCGLSPFSHMCYALILSDRGDADGGWAHGKAALALMEKLDA
ncbi:MAG: hypothetical protein GY859_08185, partial [Desulfobacterales bacterium]|nr:hypothetical protein [Desulfobacterales bacterium]